MSDFRLSTTLFALTNEWLSREYTFESLVDKTVELGLGPGLEIVGFQSVRGYPRVDPEFEKSFKALMERHKLELLPGLFNHGPGTIEFARSTTTAIRTTPRMIAGSG